MCVCVHCVFSLNGGANKIFGFFVKENKRGGFSKEGEGVNHPWMKLLCRGKKVVIKKVFHLTHEENIKETKEITRKPVKLSLPL